MLTKTPLGKAPIVIDFGKIRVQSNGLVVVIDGVFMLSKTPLGNAAIVIGFGIIWV